MPLSDEDLLRQVASGGREAFIALYDRYAPRVFGLLVKLIPDRSEAEDVLQEVMWEIWRKADRFDPAVGSAPTWILLTARSRAIDALRRMRRTGTLTERLGGEPPDQGTIGPATADTEPLGRGLAALPSDQETAIRLAFVHGLTRQQIADATGVPVGTVKTRISLGVRRLARSGSGADGEGGGG